MLYHQLPHPDLYALQIHILGHSGRLDMGMDTVSCLYLSPASFIAACALPDNPTDAWRTVVAGCEWRLRNYGSTEGGRQHSPGHMERPEHLRIFHLGRLHLP